MTEINWETIRFKSNYNTSSSWYESNDMLNHCLGFYNLKGSPRSKEDFKDWIEAFKLEKESKRYSKKKFLDNLKPFLSRIPTEPENLKNVIEEKFIQNKVLTFEEFRMIWFKTHKISNIFHLNTLTFRIIPKIERWHLEYNKERNGFVFLFQLPKKTRIDNILYNNRKGLTQKLKKKFFSLLNKEKDKEENWDNFLIKITETLNKVPYFIQVDKELAENEEITEKKLKDLCKSFTKKTKTEEIETIIQKSLFFDETYQEELLELISKKTNRNLKKLKEICAFIEIEQRGLSHNVSINRKATKEDLRKLASLVDINIPAEITGLLLLIKERCSLTENLIKSALLPPIEETMKKTLKKFPMFILREDLYIYQERGVYERQKQDVDDIIQERIRGEIPFYIKEIVGDVYIRRRVRAVMEEIKAKIRIEEKNLNLDVLNLKNGILYFEDIKKRDKIEDLKLHPHSPIYKTTLQLNIEFNPKIRCEEKLLFNSFKKRLGINQMEDLLTLYGISFLQKPQKYKKMVILVGPSGTAKSEVILQTLEELYPKENIAHADLHKLCEGDDNFESGKLMNAIINVNGELSRGDLKDQTGINRYLEEYIPVNKKHKFKGDILNRVSHFYACNRLPKLKDMDRTDTHRRLAIFDIKGNPIPQEKRNPDYFEDLIKKNPEELLFMFNKIIEALSKVLKSENKNLNLNLSYEEGMEKYKEYSNTLQSFLINYIEYEEINRKKKPNDMWLIDRDYFLKIYNKYRKKLNYEPYPSTHKLTSEMDSISYHLRLTGNRLRTKKGERVYAGIKFNKKAKKEFKIPNWHKNLKIKGEDEKELIPYYPPEEEKDKMDKIFRKQKDIDKYGNDEKKNNQNNDKLLGLDEVKEKANLDITFRARLEEIFAENNFKALDKNNIIQILELEQELSSEYIKLKMKELIKKGTIISKDD